jgi:AraC-like DNA-binding protein
MAGDDWARYWRADGVPVEAMHAHFTSHVYHRHSHESYSFGVTETGAQAFTCRHGRHVSASGMVMAFNPDDPHDGHAAVDGGFTYRMVHIWPEFLASLTGTPLPLFRSPVIEDPAMAASVREPGRRGAGRLVAARIRELIQDSAGDVGGGELTADDLAAAAGCSRYAAYRAFRQAYGLSPSDYQRQLRVRPARRLLSTGAAPAQVAADAGFADQAHLTRWFRRYYGVTPGAYRVAVSGPAGR